MLQMIQFLDIFKYFITN